MFKKLMTIFVIFVLLTTSLNCVSASNDDFKDISTVGTDITIDGNNINFGGKTVGTISKVSSIAEVENMIKDKKAIKEVYTSGLEYLADEGQYYVFEKNNQLYVMFIEQSTTDIAIACKNICQNNCNSDFNNVNGATDANGFDLDIKGKDFLK